MDKKLVVTPKVDTITIYEGKALDPKPPVQIKLSGNILAVASFLSKRYAEGTTGAALQTVDKQRAVVVVDDNNMTISLLLDPENPYGTQVEGKMLLAPELLQFNINTTKLWSREELIKIIRFNRRFFANTELYDEVLTAFQKLNVSYTTDIKQETDTRGNKDLALKRVVESQKVPTSFSLNVPVFNGFPAYSFPVEICLDVTDASVRFWFESPELAEMIETKKEEIFRDQLHYCEDFVVIHK